jgi:hypothetical protein
MMMPPAAPDSVTAISAVGVVVRPISRTSIPIARRVPDIRSLTIPPETLASLPMINEQGLLPFPFLMKVAKPEVNFTISGGVSPSPGFPPMVPLIPDIDLMRLIRGFKQK